MIEKAVLKEVVLEQKEIWEKSQSDIKRDIFDEISKYIDLPHAVVVSGLRRCGKSTLLRHIIDKYYPHGVYALNFEDERLLDFDYKDFNLLYEIFLEIDGEKKVFFFDEVQNIPQWEVFVNRMQTKGNKFFITGSNASLLSKELATRLTGRNVKVEMFPFSFNEYLKFQKAEYSHSKTLTTKVRASIKRHFSEYLVHGGMPEFLKFKETTLLKSVYDDILYRDIVARYGIKQVKALRELGLYLLSNIGSLFSYNNLKDVLGLGSMNTVKTFVDFLEDSYLFFQVSKFSFSLKEQMLNPKKIYCVDNGLIEGVAFQFSKNKGKFFENAVFMHLKRQANELYYYKTNNGLEVDFLVKKGKNNFELIQVCENIDKDKTRQREINALLKAMEELKTKHSVIVTEDTKELIEQNGKTIAVVPFYEYVLD